MKSNSSDSKCSIIFIDLELLEVASLWLCCHKGERFEYYSLRLSRETIKVQDWGSRNSNNFASQKTNTYNISLTWSGEYFRQLRMIIICREFSGENYLANAKLHFWENGHCTIRAIIFWFGHDFMSFTVWMYESLRIGKNNDVRNKTMNILKVLCWSSMK